MGSASCCSPVSISEAISSVGELEVDSGFGTILSPLRIRGETVVEMEVGDSSEKGESTSPPKMMRLGGEEYWTIEVGLSSRIMPVSSCNQLSTSFCEAAHA